MTHCWMTAVPAGPVMVTVMLAFSHGGPFYFHTGRVLKRSDQVPPVMVQS